MTQERFALLSDLNFAWDAFDFRWHQRYAELAEHVRMNGRGNVPSWKQNKQLFYWIHNQRKLYKKMLAGEKTSLTHERIRLLKKLGVL
jgi:hypothetical protein